MIWRSIICERAWFFPGDQSPGKIASKFYNLRARWREQVVQQNIFGT